MSEYLYAGTTSNSVDVTLYDSASSSGTGLSGLAYNTPGLVASYRKGAQGVRTALALAPVAVTGAWTSGGFVEIDATNMKGLYRLDLPDSGVDTAGFVSLYMYGATGLLPMAMRVDCRALPANLVAAATGAVNTLADGVLTRSVSFVESTAAEHSLCTVVLACLEYSVSGSNWNIYRTDGVTPHVVKPMTLDAAAIPVVGVT